MPVRWLTVFLDFPADTFDAVVAFWQEVTGYELSPSRGAASEFATLLPPASDAYLRVQRVREGSGGYHVDLHVDQGSLEESAARAEALGARVRHVEAELVIADSPGRFTFCIVPWEGESVVPGPLVTDGGASRVDTVCLDVPPAEFERECAFWAALTGWEPRPAPLPAFVYLTRPPGMPVRVLLQRLDSAPPGQPVRAHVDFGVADEHALSRHVGLGARVVGAHPYWTVLADPAGLEYCLVAREPDDGGQPRGATVFP